MPISDAKPPYLMHKGLLTGMMILSVLAGVSTIENVNYHAYAVYGHGTSYGPSFGGGSYHYSDGMQINGKVFDISKFSQVIPTQTLAIGKLSQITFKVFHNDGNSAIKDVVLFLNIKGNNPSVSQSDTWIQYDKYQGTTTHDPHKIFDKVKVDVSYNKTFMYVTFNLTPKSSLDTSHMIVRALDYRMYIGDSQIINGIKIS